jgi:hypothetical protein
VTVQRYCVMASFATMAGDVRQTFTVHVEASSKAEARQKGKERIAAQVSLGSSWDGEVSVYDEGEVKVLRQFGILPSKKAK